jgi:hypothetical protein
MGMYIGTPIDLQIIANANNAFGPNTNPAAQPPNGLPGTRAYFHATGEAAFDNTHTLARVAHRLGIHAKDTENDQTRGRWYGLLHHIDSTLPATRDALKTRLAQALTTLAVTQVVFNADQGAAAGYTIGFNPSGTIYYIMLHCPSDYTGATYPQNPPYRPLRDPGEPPGVRPMRRGRGVTRL